MILEKRRMKAIVRFVLIMFVFCTLVSYTGSIPVNAGISSQKHDLIEALYDLLADDADAREDILEIIVVPSTYTMKDVRKDSDAYIMADAINSVLGAGASISRETLKDLLQDFYNYQMDSPSVTRFILQQFKKGLYRQRPV